MNNTVYSKTMEKVRNRNENRNVYLKQTSKLSYLSKKIFEIDLVTIHKKQSHINA